jgi:hypothetical protein
MSSKLSAGIDHQQVIREKHSKSGMKKILDYLRAYYFSLENGTAGGADGQAQGARGEFEAPPALRAARLEHDR